MNPLDLGALPMLLRRQIRGDPGAHILRRSGAGVSAPGYSGCGLVVAGHGGPGGCWLGSQSRRRRPAREQPHATGAACYGTVAWIGWHVVAALDERGSGLCPAQNENRPTGTALGGKPPDEVVGATRANSLRRSGARVGAPGYSGCGLVVAGHGGPGGCWFGSRGQRPRPAREQPARDRAACYGTAAWI
jgi:hypothetical protein